MGLIRKLTIEARNRLEDREVRDRIITQRFFSVLPADTARVFIYCSYGSEVSTKEIIGTLLERGVSVYCPKVVGNGIHFFPVTSGEDLKPGYHGISEPDVEEEGRDIDDIIAEKAAVPDEASDCLMVMPGVVFDVEGGRMGYGAGYYDRYLAAHPCRKVALAYEMQLNSTPLDLTKDDVRLDSLITEQRYLTWERE